MAELNYYSPTAYRSASALEQSNRSRFYKKGRLDQSSSSELSWSDAQNLVPSVLLRHRTPEELKNPAEEAEFNKNAQNESRTDQECILYAPYAFRITAGIYSEGIGRVAFYACTPLALIVSIVMFLVIEDSIKAIPGYLYDMWGFFALLIGVPLLMWKLPPILFDLFPGWFGKKGQGPEWELNRRTGMVRVWHYPGRFSQRKEPEITEHPFTDFEADVRAAADQYGPWYHFDFTNRISGEAVNVGTLIGPQRISQECRALWHFLQNYMDVSRPLPDVPFLEPHRQKDPVTAAHDKEVGRPPHYWRDMDMATFEKKVEEMEVKVRSFGRT